jgi:hypothetical protein
MKFLNLVLLQLVTASVPIDRACQGTTCIRLIERDGSVHFEQVGPENESDVVLGKYLQLSGVDVPPIEAPVRETVTSGRWRIIFSVLLDHEQLEARGRVRFIDPRGTIASIAEALYYPEVTYAGRLFGDSAEIFVVSSTEEHAYNTYSQIWLLPRVGRPQLLLDFKGSVLRFAKAAPNVQPGVVVGSQTFDGVDPSTKHQVEEFYVWDAKRLKVARR